MYGKASQFTEHDAQYIFELKSLNSIERSLEKTINHRFNSKIHFRASRERTELVNIAFPPLARILEEEIGEVYEKFTPAKSSGKEMMMMNSTASKASKDSDLESPSR
jgi:hypothetical protein